MHWLDGNQRAADDGGGAAESLPPQQFLMQPFSTEDVSAVYAPPANLPLEFDLQRGLYYAPLFFSL